MFLKELALRSQDLALQGLSLVCVVYTLVLCFDCSILQASHLVTWGDLTRCTCSACEMRPDNTSTRTEACRKLWLGDDFMGRGLCWSSRVEAHHTGNDASSTEKSIPTRVHGHGAWCTQVRQQVLVLRCFPQMALCFY